jgi:hypothetical protein
MAKIFPYMNGLLFEIAVIANANHPLSRGSVPRTALGDFAREGDGYRVSLDAEMPPSASSGQ